MYRLRALPLHFVFQVCVDHRPCFISQVYASTKAMLLVDMLLPTQLLFLLQSATSIPFPLQLSYIVEWQ